MTFQIETRRERLTIVSLKSPSSEAEAHGATRLLTAIFQSHRKRGFLVADCTGVNLLPTPVADAFVEVMRRGNPFIERTAILMDSHSSMFQMYRIIKDSNHPRRQMFKCARDLDNWLGPVLSTPEHSELYGYLLRHGLFETAATL